MALTLTLTIQKNQTGRENERVSPREKKALVDIDWPGAETYDTGPALSTTPGDWGFIRQINRIVIVDMDAAAGLVWKYDHLNKKLRAYEGDYAQAGDAPLVELDAGDTPAAGTLTVHAYGW